METSHFLLLPLKRGGIAYLFRDEFTSDASAPLPNPSLMEPGPGQWTPAQNDGQFSKSSGKLNIPAQASAAYGDLHLIGAAHARVAGRAMFAQLRFSTLGSNLIVGWSVNNTGNFSGGAGSTAVFFFSGAAGLFATPGLAQLLATIATATDYVVCSVLRSSGNFLFMNIGGTWKLLFVDRVDNTATLYPVVVNLSDVATMDYIRGRDLPAPFNGDYLFATVNEAAPVHLTQYTATADQVIEADVTAPGSLADEAGFRYRILDANNYWRAYFNASGAFRVDSVSAGVATNRINVAAVISGGQTRTIQIPCEGSLHDAYTLAGTTWTKRGSQINVSHQNGQADIAADIGAGWTVANLRSYPRTSVAYTSELSRV